MSFYYQILIIPCNTYSLTAFGRLDEVLSILQLSWDIFQSTVVLNRESKWHDLWSKWPISDLMFYNIKMPPSSCPLGFSLLLTGALKWGTVQTSTSTYTGIMQGQT